MCYTIFTIFTHLVLSVVGKCFVMSSYCVCGETVSLYCCLYTFCPFSIDSVCCVVYTNLGLSVVRQFLCHVVCTHIVLSVVSQYSCPAVCIHLFLSVLIQFNCLCHTTCPGGYSGQSMSPYCDFEGYYHIERLSCLPDYKASAFCDLYKHQSVIDAKFQV